MFLSVWHEKNVIYSKLVNNPFKNSKELYNLSSEGLTDDLQFCLCEFGCVVDSYDVQEVILSAKCQCRKVPSIIR